VSKASPWVVNLLLLALTCVLMYWVLSNLAVIRKSVSSTAAVDRLPELERKYDEVICKNKSLERSSVLLEGMKITCAEVRLLVLLLLSGECIVDKGSAALESIAVRLAIGMKSYSNETHRCAIWAPVDDKTLGLVAGSAGFDSLYKL